MSNEVSLRRDRTFVVRTPAAEKARSASTDVVGMVSKYAYRLYLLQTTSSRAAIFKHSKLGFDGICQLLTDGNAYCV